MSAAQFLGNLHALMESFFSRRMEHSSGKTMFRMLSIEQNDALVFALGGASSLVTICLLCLQEATEGKRQAGKEVSEDSGRRNHKTTLRNTQVGQDCSTGNNQGCLRRWWSK